MEGRDHPRIRGEHIGHDRPNGGVHGIIPAYAGSTLDMSGYGSDPWGSSPHTRGALDQGARGFRIPRDHPRIRGEHDALGYGMLVALGIIPAYAGSTSSSATTCRCRQGSSPHTRGARTRRCACGTSPPDHPRIRGEHRVLGGLPRLASGIIPAYAGSTITVMPRKPANQGSSPHTRGALEHDNLLKREPRDHPRIRGEHDVVYMCCPLLLWIIPAYAGSTLSHVPL